MRLRKMATSAPRVEKRLASVSDASHGVMEAFSE
jgi:hypothetical protein